MKIEIKISGQFVRGVLEGLDSQRERAIILVHGFSGNMDGPDNIFAKLSKRLQQDGFCVIRFNFRGTKPSDGKQEGMTIESEKADLKAVVRYAKELGFKRIGIVAESLGGFVAASCYTEDIDCIVFWYPAFDLPDTDFRQLFSEKPQSQLKESNFVEMWGFRIGRKLFSEIKKGSIYEKIKKIKCPVMFLHGDSDSDVPYQQSEKAFSLVNNPKKIRLLKGADHCFGNEQEEAINLTSDFLKNCIGKLI